MQGDAGVSAKVGLELRRKLMGGLVEPLLLQGGGVVEDLDEEDDGALAVRDRDQMHLCEFTIIRSGCAHMKTK